MKQHRPHTESDRGLLSRANCQSKRADNPRGHVSICVSGHGNASIVRSYHFVKVYTVKRDVSMERSVLNIACLGPTMVRDISHRGTLLCEFK